MKSDKTYTVEEIKKAILSLKRYDKEWTCYYCSMDESEYGDYVKFEDLIKIFEIKY